MKRKYRFSDPCVRSVITETNSFNFPTSQHFQIKCCFVFRVNGKGCWQLTTSIHPQNYLRRRGNAVFGHNFSCSNWKRNEMTASKGIYFKRNTKNKNRNFISENCIYCENAPQVALMLKRLTMCELYGYCIGSPGKRQNTTRIKSNEIQ